MTQREGLLVLGGVLVAVALSVILVLAAAQRPTEQRQRPGVRPVPTPRPVVDVARRLPEPLRFLAPVTPLQRGVSDVASAGAGFLLLLVLTAGTVVVARGQVVRAHAASAGPILDQARVLGVGVGVLLAGASVAILGWILVVANIATRDAPFRAFGLQVLVTGVALVVLAVLAVALVGFAATAWRLGVAILGWPAVRKWGERVPAPLAALLGATILYLLAQLPLVGPLIVLAILAYALGAFVLARVTATAS